MGSNRKAAAVEEKIEDKEEEEEEEEEEEDRVVVVSLTSLFSTNMAISETKEDREKSVRSFERNCLPVIKYTKLI